MKKKKFNTETIEHLVDKHIREEAVATHDEEWLAILRDVGVDTSKYHTLVDASAKRDQLLQNINSPTFIKVVEFVVKRGCCSTRELQQHFQWGYAKTASYIDALEALNLVSKFRIVSEDELPAPREALPGAKAFLEYYK